MKYCRRSSTHRPANPPRLLAALALLALVLAAGGRPSWSAVAPVTFQAPVRYAAPASFELQSADLDRDGFQDVVTLSRNNAAVYYARPDGTFQAPINYFISSLSLDGAGSLLVQDIDQDGLPDLLVTATKRNRFILRRNQGKRFFSPAVEYPTLGQPYGLATVDLDWDGNLDVIVGGRARLELYVLYGPPQSVRFSAALLRTLPGIPGRLAAVPRAPSSYDDGVVLDGTNKVLFGAQEVSFDMESPFDITTGDFTGDGRLDFAVTRTETRRVTVYSLNDLETEYVSHQSASLAASASRIATADFDVDGDLDIVAATPERDAVEVALNDGTGRLDRGPAFATGGRVPGYVAAGDFNGDGLPDVAALNASTQELSILLNSTSNAPPTAPAGLAATPVSGARIDLSWQDRSGNESAFSIERKSVSQPYAVIGATGANITRFTDTPLAPNTLYTYRVRATNAQGNSPYSAEAAATTPPQTLPAAPSNLELEVISQTYIRAKWLDNSGDETGFKIERKEGPAGSGGAFEVAAQVGANVAVYSDTGLTPGTTYTYRIRSTNGGGDSLPSVEVTATTFTAIPTPPTGLIGAPVSSTEILLTWQDTSTTELAFVIERRTGSGGYVDVGIAGQNATGYIDNGLQPSTAYSYRVRTTGDAGDSAPSDPITVSTYPPPPAPPTELTVTSVSQSTLRLDWRDNSANETGFRVERRVTGGPFLLFRNVDAGTTTTTDAGHSPGEQFTYRVIAVGLGGESAPSNEATGGTLPNPPAPPTNLTATPVSGTEVILTWQHQGDTETGFSIERKGIGAFAPVGSAGANATSYRDTGLSPQSQYTYRVRAKNDGGESAPSNEVTVTTLGPAPQPPGSLQATVRLPNTVELTWKDLSRDETGFKIERKAGSDAFAVLTTVGAGVTRYLDTGLAAGATYVYRVRAVSANGDSAPSNEATAVVPAAGGKLVVDAKLDFGSVRVRTRKEKGLKVRNAGSSPLQVTVEVPGAPFGLKGGRQAFTLAAGASRSVMVTFQPTRKGRATGSLSIGSTDPARPTGKVSLVGTGT